MTPFSVTIAVDRDAFASGTDFRVAMIEALENAKAKIMESGTSGNAVDMLPGSNAGVLTYFYLWQDPRQLLRLDSCGPDDLTRHEMSVVMYQGTLSPCPFCGDPHSIMISEKPPFQDAWRSKIFCGPKGCGCHLYAWHQDREESNRKAIGLWNKRVLPEQSIGSVQTLPSRYQLIAYLESHNWEWVCKDASFPGLPEEDSYCDVGGKNWLIQLPESFPELDDAIRIALSTVCLREKRPIASVFFDVMSMPDTEPPPSVNIPSEPASPAEDGFDDKDPFGCW